MPSYYYTHGNCYYTNTAGRPPISGARLRLPTVVITYLIMETVIFTMIPGMLRLRRCCLVYYCMKLIQFPPPAGFIRLQLHTYVTYSLPMAFFINFHACSAIGAHALHFMGLTWGFACGLATLSIKFMPLACFLMTRIIITIIHKCSDIGAATFLIIVCH